EFPVTRKWAYFDHAGVSPLPRSAGAILRLWTEEQATNGATGWGTWARKLGRIREAVARLVGADREGIALIQKKTHGNGLIGEGFPWRQGDNIVTSADEYPGNIFPWMNLASRGVRLRQVAAREDGRVSLDELRRALDDRSRLVAISHVEFATGFRNDLAA